MKFHFITCNLSIFNVSVKLSGIPVTLTKLEKVDISAEKDCKNECQEGKNENKCPFALFKLTDIKVSIDANAATDDSAGVVFPFNKK